MSETVLLAGASGMLGRRIAGALRRRGLRVRAFVRSAEALARSGASADEVVEDGSASARTPEATRGVAAVISCLGASVQPTLGRGWRGFMAVDARLNLGLIDAAEAAGVGRFVYVSVLHTPEMRRLAYVEAHERVAARLRGGRLAGVVLRPTGFFSALEAYLEMARRGPIPLFGDGSARSNPIHDEDLAEACVAALEGPPGVRTAGGPDVLTRRELAAMACEAVSVAPRFREVPAALVRAAGALLRPFHPRLGQLMQFYAAVTTTDLVAEAVGRRRLVDYFRERAG